MQDKTIDSALLNLRRNMIRDECEGLHHVEALLVQRGVALPRVLRRWGPYVSGKGMMAHMAMAALKNGPQKAVDVSKCIALQRPELPLAQTHKLTANALTKLKDRGLVVHDGRMYGLWRLA